MLNKKRPEARGIGKKVTPEAANEMRDQWVSLNRQAAVCLGKKDPEVNRAWTEALAKHPNLEQDYARRNETYKNITSGKAGDTLRSFETVANHSTLREAARELPNTSNVQAMNAWKAKTGENRLQAIPPSLTFKPFVKSSQPNCKKLRPVPVSVRARNVKNMHAS
jgi:hypothetical protein